MEFVIVRLLDYCWKKREIEKRIRKIRELEEDNDGNIVRGDKEIIPLEEIHEAMRDMKKRS